MLETTASSHIITNDMHYRI